jgi:outer membrane protein OmpA-like peptidoglycan-associated protein
MRSGNPSIASLAPVALLALGLLLPAGCGSHAATGAAVGAAVGAATGAVVGNQSGHAKEGAVIGAVAGGALGGVVGARMDRQAEELAQVAETQRTERGVIVTLSSDKIQFDFNSSVVKIDSRQTLVELADVLTKYPEDVIIVAGHTDSDGKDEYNLRLSEMRAQAVVDILAANGVPIASIQAHGYGETQPVASNDTAEGKTLNRRVELSITVDESKVPKE